jgi:hypothetical protein
VAAAANVLGEDAFVVLGSQAILGPHPNAPPALLRSMEADLYPKSSPERSVEIDGSLGDGSPFHEAYGYYAHGVGPETAKAPAGWETRLVAIDIPPRPASERTPVAYCLEPHDLVLAKCVAGRPRDWQFAEDCLHAGIADLNTLVSRAEDLPVEANRKRAIAEKLEASASEGPD